MALMVDGASLEETRERVLAWFAEAGRDLPWRATRDPYRVLVAEVLAQQTQAARAAAAWPRFLERFPDVATLAAAAPAEVLRAWQGLGYNRRALALHRTAQAVEGRGGWPDTVEGLAGLPGVGPYTARAVACFALGRRVAPVDTNVARVLARSLAGADPAQLSPAARQRLADQALPPPAHGPAVAGAPDPSGRAWTWSSALMDVGALHCRPRPRCEGCPLAPSCRWRALGPAAPPPRPRAQAPFATSDRRWRGAWPAPPTAWTGPPGPTPCRRPPPTGPPAGSTPSWAAWRPRAWSPPAPMAVCTCPVRERRGRGAGRRPGWWRPTARTRPWSSRVPGPAGGRCRGRCGARSGRGPAPQGDRGPGRRSRPGGRPGRWLPPAARGRWWPRTFAALARRPGPRPAGRWSGGRPARPWSGRARHSGRACRGGPGRRPAPAGRAARRPAPGRRRRPAAFEGLR